jgi:hypothetical protein
VARLGRGRTGVPDRRAGHPRGPGRRTSRGAISRRTRPGRPCAIFARNPSPPGAASPSQWAWGMSFTIDGKRFDPDRTDQVVATGSVEEWTVVNTSPMDHPLHLHVWPMQVTAPRGEPVAKPTWQDVVNIPARSQITLRVAFDNFVGRTVYHCHVLDHEDRGMMGVIVASNAQMSRRPPHAPVGRTSEDLRPGYQACIRAPWWTISASAVDQRLLTQTPRAEALSRRAPRGCPALKSGIARPGGRIFSSDSSLACRCPVATVYSPGPLLTSPHPVASSSGKHTTHLRCSVPRWRALGCETSTATAGKRPARNERRKPRSAGFPGAAPEAQLYPGTWCRSLALTAWMMTSRRGATVQWSARPTKVLAEGHDARMASPAPPSLPQYPVELIESTEARRLATYQMMWQVPALSLTAQSFLLTISLGSGTVTGRVIASGLGAIAAFATIQLLLKQRCMELTQSRILERIEADHNLQPLHTHPAMVASWAWPGPAHDWEDTTGRLGALRCLRLFLVNTRALNVWLLTLCMFTFADLLIAVLSILRIV